MEQYNSRMALSFFLTSFVYAEKGFQNCTLFAKFQVLNCRPFPTKNIWHMGARLKNNNQNHLLTKFRNLLGFRKRGKDLRSGF